MTGKLFFTVLLIIIGLPIIVPLTLLLFWYKCAMNAAEKIIDNLDDTDTEPDYVVEAIDDFNKRSSRAKAAENLPTLDDIGNEIESDFKKKYPMSTLKNLKNNF